MFFYQFVYFYIGNNRFCIGAQYFVTPYNAGGKYSPEQPGFKKGYSYNKRQQNFESTIKGKYIGNYPTWEGAALAYDRKALSLVDGDVSIFNTGQMTNFTLAEYRERIRGCGDKILTCGEVQAATKTSVYAGVSYDSTKHIWAAWVSHRGKHHKIGCFKTEREAAEAYNTKLTILYGPNAKLNDIK